LIKSNTTPCGAVLNAIPSNTTVANSAEDFLIESGFELLGRVGHRMAIQHALTAGLGVVELEPNSSASEDITFLWNKIVERTAV
jgi:MinD-like ATPase involved in chromosome partitioning or flagellar assembly